MDKKIFSYCAFLTRKQANHGAYSNPCTQVGAHNKDLGAVSLNQSLVSPAVQAY